MTFVPSDIKKQLPDAWRTQPVDVAEVEIFVVALQRMLSGLNEKESEEHNKNLVRDFLKEAFPADYANRNTKGRVDLAVYQEGVPIILIEAKAPGKNTDFPTAGQLNTKALHELLRYYMSERLEHHNDRVTHLVITNGWDWYIFDAQHIDRLFYQNTAFKKKYQEWIEGRLSNTKTDHFYKEIAKPFIEQQEGELPYLYLNLKELGKRPENLVQLCSKDGWLRAFRVFHPYFLAKKPLLNRGNTLNLPFYLELLHLLGLYEEGDKKPKPITRLPEQQRESGSLIENTIRRMQDKDVLSRHSRLASEYGDKPEQQLFGMAFELVSTWLNRILFLKLLEGQLVQYHLNEQGEAGDQNLTFLHIKALPDFTALNRLFFQVLARKQDERDPELNPVFGHIPYLNSSLFDRTRLENELAIEIDTLDNRAELKPFGGTVLRPKDRPKASALLPYLFDFLDAYDFSTVEVREVRKGDRGLIDARVLGLVFEKLNGYKDGSFYTPSFVTMFMAREAVHRAATARLNEAFGWQCQDYAALKEQLTELDKTGRKKASGVLCSLRIIDPAVGSGHFLVSVLNQLIYTLWELRLLFFYGQDTIVSPASYEFSIVEDELVILDDKGDKLRYLIRKDGKPNSEIQELQVTLFHLKQLLIENCLFGVDINPASVYICRLRLWIELLKHAYYAAPDYRHMETLPNLDINIKPGNSLISRFELERDLTAILGRHQWTLESYLATVTNYKSTTGSQEKRKLMALIDQIKMDLRQDISQQDPIFRQLAKKKNEFEKLYGGTLLTTDMTKAEQAKDKSRKAKMSKEISALDAELKEKREGTFYQDAFEWRFEFPEVLNLKSSAFQGFDLVVGNPPYIRQEQIQHLKPVLKKNYNTYTGTADIYVFFFELGYQLLRPGGTLAYITSNKFMRAGYGEKLRAYLQQHMTIRTLVDFGDLPVFDEAIAYPVIYVGQKQQPAPTGTGLHALTVTDRADMKTFAQLYDTQALRLAQQQLEPTAWRLEDPQVSRLLDKMRRAGTPLGEYVGGKIFYGIKTGLNEAFVVDAATKDHLIAEDPRSEEVLKPFLRGRDIKRYERPVAENWVILLPKGITIKSVRDGQTLPAFLQNNTVEDAPARYGTIPYEEAEAWLQETYPAIFRWLQPFKEAAEKRHDQGDFWWELRACDYYSDFISQKIVLAELSKENNFTQEGDGCFYDTTSFIIPLCNCFLLAVLNSKIVLEFLASISSSVRGGYLRWKKQYLFQIPIPTATKAQQKELEHLAQAVIAAKEKNAATLDLEAKIDDIVCALYGLSEKEKEMIKR